MKFGWSLALAGLVVAGTAFAQDTTTDKGKVSYAVGYDLGAKMKAQSGTDLDINTVVKALQDGFAGRATAVPEDQLRAAMEKYAEKKKGEAEQELAANKRSSDAFMASNRSKKGILALPSGVQYQVIDEGSGKQVTANAEVTMHFRISKTDGQELRSTFAGPPPSLKTAELTQVSGNGNLAEVVQRMKVGDYWRVFLPPDQSTNNLVVIWEIKIVDVK